MGLGCKGLDTKLHQQWRVPEGSRRPEEDGREEESACWIGTGRDWRQFEGTCNNPQGEEPPSPLHHPPALILDYGTG